EGEEDPKREEEQEEGGFALEQQTEQPQDQPGWKPQEQKPLKRPFLVHLTPEQHEKLAEIADASGESRASHVRQALNRYLFQR
ncbi:ribbon-helix-helix protein, CopG family, partial [Haloarcula sp. AONF1]